jgi:hypothetical protein
MQILLRKGSTVHESCAEREIAGLHRKQAARGTYPTKPASRPLQGFGWVSGPSRMRLCISTKPTSAFFFPLTSDRMIAPAIDSGMLMMAGLRNDTNHH